MHHVETYMKQSDSFYSEERQLKRIVYKKTLIKQLRPRVPVKQSLLHAITTGPPPGARVRVTCL